MSEIAQKGLTSEQSPRRMRAMFSVIKKMIAHNVTIVGEENVVDAQDTDRLIVATTHTTDFDLPLVVATLAGNLDMLVTDMSLNHKLGSPGSRLDKLGLMAIGENNFVPLDYQNATDGTQVPGVFNPDNFVPLLEQIDTGKRVVIAGQSASSNGLFDRPGVAVPYLASYASASILPVAVQMHDGGNKRPDATVYIGEPFLLDSVPYLGALRAVLNKRKRGLRISRGELDEYAVARMSLKKQGAFVIEKLVSLTDQN